MSKLLVVFGATGQQGGSVIESVLKDPTLSKEYRVRALSRNTESEKSKQLSLSSEVVYCDVQDRASVKAALVGAHTVFAMTNPTFGSNGFEEEYQSAKTIADVAVEESAKYIIFSTLPSLRDTSHGKYTRVAHFEAKAEAERYIRALPIASSFVSLGFFMGNFHLNPFLAPQRKDDRTWVMTRPNAPRARMPMIDAAEDTGKFVGAILANPDKFEGMTISAAAASYSFEETAAIMSQLTGKSVVYQQIPLEDWKGSLPFGADAFGEAFSAVEEFGYYGSESEELVKWAAENARGAPTTLKAYLTANPLHLA